MGIGLGPNIFSRPLTMIGKVSLRCVTSQAARTRPSVLLRSLTWFPRRGGNLNGPGGSTSPGWKRSGTALPFFSFEEVVNPAGLAGKGYNRFDTL